MIRSAAVPQPSLRALALVIAVIGLVLCAYVEFALTTAAAPDRFGWFVYEAAAWLLLLGIGPFLPVGMTVLVGALTALGLEGFAFWRAFADGAAADGAAVYLWKPLAQVALIGAAWFAGYLTYLRAQREHG